MSGRPAVRDTLKELGLAPSKSRGQNFLKDENRIAAIVGAIINAAGSTSKLLEIGPGLGALTLPLLASGASVTAVELDRGLAENLSLTAAAEYPGRLNIIHQDILTVEPGPLAKEAKAPLFVCGNLPYNISSPVLFWFLRHRHCFSGAMFMLQKEMADRLAAVPGTKDYGRLTVALGLWCQVAKVMSVPPSAFHPRPRVESVIISLRPRQDDEAADITVSPEALGRFTAAAFAARRKTIFNNLSKVYGRDQATAALETNSIEPGLRAETLSPRQLAALAGCLETTV
ncbi:ribosomal RNA small subunit methyltransferase A [Deltaproteobacteria bacterium Smac51]|nr:ribosomal RNA small subunit methyltransferase A [Deltaproteobacteria bacterium Smac51]